MKNRLVVLFNLFLIMGLFSSCSEPVSSDDNGNLDCDENFTKTKFTDDRDGQIYESVKIGNQIWMSENLKYLPHVNSGNDGSEDVDGVSYYYVYDFMISSGVDALANISNAKSTIKFETYGVLYNFYAVNNTIIPVCPTGWHVPDTTEWQELYSYIENDQSSTNGGIGIGSYLKSSDECLYGEDYDPDDHWDIYGWSLAGDGPGDGTDDYGFTALPGGFRGDSGYFVTLNDKGYWWSSTESNDSEVFISNLSFNDDLFNMTETSKDFGHSVRCIQD